MSSVAIMPFEPSFNDVVKLVIVMLNNRFRAAVESSRANAVLMTSLADRYLYKPTMRDFYSTALLVSAYLVVTYREAAEELAEKIKKCVSYLGKQISRFFLPSRHSFFGFSKSVIFALFSYKLTSSVEHAVFGGVFSPVLHAALSVSIVYPLHSVSDYLHPMIERGVTVAEITDPFTREVISPVVPLVRVAEMATSAMTTEVTLDKTLAKVCIYADGNYQVIGQAFCMEMADPLIPQLYYMFTAAHVIQTSGPLFLVVGTNTWAIPPKSVIVHQKTDYAYFPMEPGVKSSLALKSRKFGLLDYNKQVSIVYLVNGVCKRSTGIASRNTDGFITTTYSSFPSCSGAPLLQNDRVVAVHCGANPMLANNYASSLRTFCNFEFKPLGKILPPLMGESSLSTDNDYDDYDYHVSDLQEILEHGYAGNPGFFRNFGREAQDDLLEIAGRFGVDYVDEEVKIRRNFEQEMMEIGRQGYTKNSREAKSIISNYATQMRRRRESATVPLKIVGNLNLIPPSVPAPVVVENFLPALVPTSATTPDLLKVRGQVGPLSSTKLEPESIRSILMTMTTAMTRLSDSFNVNLQPVPPSNLSTILEDSSSSTLLSETESLEKLENAGDEHPVPESSSRRASRRKQRSSSLTISTPQTSLSQTDNSLSTTLKEPSLPDPQSLSLRSGNAKH